MTEPLGFHASFGNDRSRQRNPTSAVVPPAKTSSRRALGHRPEMTRPGRRAIPRRRRVILPPVGGHPQQARRCARSVPGPDRDQPSRSCGRATARRSRRTGHRRMPRGRVRPRRPRSSTSTAKRGRQGFDPVSSAPSRLARGTAGRSGPQTRSPRASPHPPIAARRPGSHPNRPDRLRAVEPIRALVCRWRSR